MFRISHVFYVMAFSVNDPNCINFKSNILTTFAQPTFNKCLKLLKRAKQSSDSRMEQLKLDLILRQLKTILSGKSFCLNKLSLIYVGDVCWRRDNGDGLAILVINIQNCHRHLVTNITIVTIKLLETTLWPKKFCFPK